MRILVIHPLVNSFVCTGKAAAALLLLDDPSSHYGKKYMLTRPEDIDNENAAKILSEVLKAEIKFACNLLQGIQRHLFMK